MKILTIADVPEWAIGKLTKSIIKHNTQHNFKELYVHPKKVSQYIESVVEEVKSFQPNVIHFCYWNTAQQLLKAIPILRNIPSVLTHHNQKDLLAEDWNALGINKHICHTNYSYVKLTEAGYDTSIIRHGLDFSQFPYRDKQPDKFSVGFTGRAVPWKGFKEVVEVCDELGVELKMMGKLTDKPDYVRSIDQVALAKVDMEFVQCSDNDRKDFYHNIGVYVGFSSDGREEGTLPFLEAMACGVPVITTPSGTANDITNEDNSVVIPFDDIVALKHTIKNARDGVYDLEKIRKNAWNTVKNLDERLMARKYNEIYHKLYSDSPLVSVIIPATYDRIDNVREIITSLENQTYNHIEIIVVWDEVDIVDTNIVSDKTLMQLYTGKSGYNLATARNMGIVEANGKYIMFCDSRMKPNNDAIEQFMKIAWMEHPDARLWVFGDKGADKKEFVENFSLIRKDLLVEAGMMNERIDEYGGMSQELRIRFLKQKFTLKYIERAKASQISKSSMTLDRRYQIINSKLKLYKIYGEN